MGHKKKHLRKKKVQVGKQHCLDAAIKKLEIVLKGDTAGSVEAVREVLSTVVPKGFQLDIISIGVGAVCQNDAVMAETGSRLIIGFNVGVLPHVEEFCKLHNIEIRLYEVIYKIGEELKNIIASLAPVEIREVSLGTARVIALFKSSRGGIILGCEVERGRLQVGDNFKVISAMGPVYTGRIHSLHIDKDAVKKATPGQQVGLKIVDFKKGKVGDIVESYQLIKPDHGVAWTPKGGIGYR